MAKSATKVKLRRTSNAGQPGLRNDLLLSFGVPLLIAVIAFGTAISLYPKLPVIQDAYCYNMSAQRVLVDRFFSHDVMPPGTKIAPDADTTPGYHLVLASLYALTGSVSSDPAASVVAVMPAVKFVQFLFALGVVACVAGSGRLLGGSRLALLSGTLAALYLPFAWSTSVALSESLGTLLIALQLLLAIAMNGKPGRHDFLLFAGFGLASGAVALVRPAMSLWAFIPLAMVVWRRRGEMKHLAALLGVTLLAAMLLLGPWWIRNEVVLHRFIPLSEGAGLPMFQAAGGAPMSTAEKAAYDAAEAAGGDGFAAAAKYRIAQQLRSNPGAFLGARLKRAASVVVQPWSAPLDVYGDVKHDPNGPAVRLGAFAGDPSSAFRTALQFTAVYHLFLIALLIPACLLVARSPRLLLALSLPVYSAVVHMPTLYIDRYFSPAMPGVLLAASVVLYFAGRRVAAMARADSGSAKGARA